MSVITSRTFDHTKHKKETVGESKTKPNPNSLSIGQLFRDYAGGTQGIEMASVYLDPQDFSEEMPDLGKMTRREVAQYQISLQSKLRSVARQELEKRRDEVKNRTPEQVQQIEKEEKQND